MITNLFVGLESIYGIDLNKTDLLSRAPVHGQSRGGVAGVSQLHPHPVSTRGTTVNSQGQGYQDNRGNNHSYIKFSKLYSERNVFDRERHFRKVYIVFTTWGVMGVTTTFSV